MPLPGVKCGDMGPKLGYQSKNNGWASFDQVRIPRDWLPMRFVSVDREGTFSVGGDTRGLYSAMMDIRVFIVVGASHALHHACLIGLRYSAVRR